MPSKEYNYEGKENNREQIFFCCLMVGERLCLKAMEKDLAKRLVVEKTQREQ